MLVKVLFIWGFLLFIFSRFLFYLFTFLFSQAGLGINAELLSALILVLFAGFACYKGVITLSKSEKINKLFTPIIVGFGIVFISLLFNAIFSFIILGQLDSGYSIGLLRFIASVAGGYIAVLKVSSRNS